MHGAENVKMCHFLCVGVERKVVVMSAFCVPFFVSYYSQYIRVIIPKHEQIVTRTVARADSRWPLTAEAEFKPGTFRVEVMVNGVSLR